MKTFFPTTISFLLSISTAVSGETEEGHSTNVSTKSVIAGFKPGIKSIFEKQGPPIRLDGRRRLQWPFAQSCTTPMSEWITEESNKLSYSTLNDYVDLQIGLLPFLSKALFDDNEGDEFIGENGEYTNELFERNSQLERFWRLENPDISTSESLLLGAHGSMLRDTDKLARIAEIVYEVNAGYSYEDVALLIQEVVEDMPGTYSNPLLTFNAVALSSLAASREFGIDVVDSIVMGDGIIEAIQAQGFGTDGPDFVLSHEFAHILQYELGNDPPVGGYSPGENRRQEMMADAMASYFMAHPEGGAHSVEEVDELHVTASLLGDYQFTQPDHHGTPAQRECSVLWAAGLGFEASEIIPLTEFIDVFDEHYDMLLSTNDTLCPTVVERPECGSSGATSSWRVIGASVAVSVLGLLLL